VNLYRCPLGVFEVSGASWCRAFRSWRPYDFRGRGRKRCGAAFRGLRNWRSRLRGRRFHPTVHHFFACKL